MAMENDVSDPARVVDGLVGAIKTIANDSNYNLLAGIFNEVIVLRAKNAELVDTNRNVFEQYWVFRRELEDARQKLEAAKAELESELSGKIQELADMTEARDKLDGELISTKDTLGETVTAKEKLEADLEVANTDLADLKTAKQSVEDDLAQVTERLEEQKRISEACAEENAALQVTLAERDLELEKTKTSLQDAISVGDDLKSTLTGVEADLAAKNSRLTELDSYRVVLRDEGEDTCVKILDTIWSKIFGLVETHFREDLEDHVINDASCWKNLRGSSALRGPTQIPLPQSNSPVAKAMRIAAVLSVLSRAMHHYIFRPFYLIDDDTDLATLLHEVQIDYPAKEEHIRATLLATLPKLQQENARNRARHVVREVSWAIQHLLGALAYNSFCTGLTSACSLACEEWQKIQNARMKIEPYFGPPYDEFEWQVLPLPELECRRIVDIDAGGVALASSRGGSSRGGVDDDASTTVKADDETGNAEEPTKKELSDEEVGNGSDSGVDVDGGAATNLSSEEDQAKDGEQDEEKKETPEQAEDQKPEQTEGQKPEQEQVQEQANGETDDNKNNNDNSNDTAIADDDDENDKNDDEDANIMELDPDNILLVVWPTMVVVENGEQQPITQGLVISKEQASLAFHELQVARTGQRLTFKKARTMSIPSLSGLSMPASNTNSGANTPSFKHFLGPEPGMVDSDLGLSV